MDLSTIAPATIEVDIRHPATGEPTGLTIECSSLDTEAVQKVRRRHANDALKSRNRKVTAEQLEESSTDLLLAAIIGWKWADGATWGGKKLDFNPDNLRTVVTTPWVKRQVEEAIGDESAFFQN